MIVKVPLMKSVLVEQFSYIIYLDQTVSRKDTILDSVYKKLFDLKVKPTDYDNIHNYVANSGLSYNFVSLLMV